MAIDKTSWHKLGLTPRQFSKKMGVTHSMAEFIVYGPPDACKLESSKKKNPCTTECRSQSEETTPVVAHCSTKSSKDKLSDSDDISTPCASKKTSKDSTSTRTCNIAPNTRCEKPDQASTLCRKRRPEEELSDNDASCSDSQSDTDGDDGYSKTATTTHRSCPSRRKRCKGAPRRKARCSNTKKKQRGKEKNQRKKPVKDKPRKKETCPKKETVIPLNVCLEVPLNVYLGENDNVWMDQEAKACIKCKGCCPDVQDPPGDQECKNDQVSKNCRKPRREHSPHQGEEGDDEEEACSDGSVRTKKGSCCEERVCCDHGAVTQGSNPPMSLWEECVAYLESFLAALVNKC